MLPLRAAGLILVLLLNHAASGSPEWAGSKACASCHRSIYESWSKTPMAQSSGDAASLPATDPGQSFSDSRSVYRYAISQRAGGYALKITSADPAVPTIQTQLRYFVGSGASARSFLIDDGGFLYEAPVAWYSHTGKWGFAPGYEKYSAPYLARAVAPGCLECHATSLRAVAGTQNGYRSPPFAEGGVGCERCHGPGGAHARSGKREDIVNPARLDAERRDSVCEQCHLSGEVRVPRRPDSYRPGEKFADYAISFSRETSPGRVTVTSHVEDLARSACRRASGDRMWCGSCHDPHSTISDRAAWFRAKCLACHAESSCTEKPAARAARSDNCIDCHMPRRHAADAVHVISTDHSIPRFATRTNAGERPPRRDAPLTPIGPHAPAAGSRDLGLAYAILADREQNAAYRNRAFDLLRDAERSHPNDPQLLAYLAEIYRGRSDDAQAIPLYEKLLRLDPSQAAAPAALGAYAMERGDYQQAIRLWRQALRISPSLPLARANLAVALIKTGHPEDAREVLRKALQFNPGFSAARQLLDRLR